MDVTVPPAPKSRKGQERRRQIIEAATDAFAVHGYRSVSLASIAPKVGLTEQGAMHYFPTKEHLLLGVLEHRDERDSEYFARLFAEHGLSLLDGLVVIMRHHVDQEPGLATLYSVLMAESVDPAHPAHAWFVARNARVRAVIAEAVARSQAAGEIRKDVDPAAVAAQIIAMFDGLALQWSLDRERLDLVGIMEEFTRGLRI